MQIKSTSENQKHQMSNTNNPQEDLDNYEEGSFVVPDDYIEYEEEFQSLMDAESLTEDQEDTEDSFMKNPPRSEQDSDYHPSDSVSLPNGPRMSTRGRPNGVKVLTDQLDNMEIHHSAYLRIILACMRWTNEINDRIKGQPREWYLFKLDTKLQKFMYSVEDWEESQIEGGIVTVSHFLREWYCLANPQERTEVTAHLETLVEQGELTQLFVYDEADHKGLEAEVTADEERERSLMARLRQRAAEVERVSEAMDAERAALSTLPPGQYQRALCRLEFTEAVNPHPVLPDKPLWHVLEHLRRKDYYAWNTMVDDWAKRLAKYWLCDGFYDSLDSNEQRETFELLRTMILEDASFPADCLLLLDEFCALTENERDTVSDATLHCSPKWIYHRQKGVWRCTLRPREENRWFQSPLDGESDKDAGDRHGHHSTRNPSGGGSGNPAADSARSHDEGAGGGLNGGGAGGVAHQRGLASATRTDRQDIACKCGLTSTDQLQPRPSSTSFRTSLPPIRSSLPTDPSPAFRPSLKALPSRSTLSLSTVDNSHTTSSTCSTKSVADFCADFFGEDAPTVEPKVASANVRAPSNSKLYPTGTSVASTNGEVDLEFADMTAGEAVNVLVSRMEEMVRHKLGSPDMVKTKVSLGTQEVKDFVFTAGTEREEFDQGQQFFNQANRCLRSTDNILGVKVAERIIHFGVSLEDLEHRLLDVLGYDQERIEACEHTLSSGETPVEPKRDLLKYKHRTALDNIRIDGQSKFRSKLELDERRGMHFTEAELVIKAENVKQVIQIRQDKYLDDAYGEALTHYFEVLEAHNKAKQFSSQAKQLRDYQVTVTLLISMLTSLFKRIAEMICSTVTHKSISHKLQGEVKTLGGLTLQRCGESANLYGIMRILYLHYGKTTIHTFVNALERSIQLPEANTPGKLVSAVQKHLLRMNQLRVFDYFTNEMWGLVMLILNCRGDLHGEDFKTRLQFEIRKEMAANPTDCTLVLGNIYQWIDLMYDKPIGKDGSQRKLKHNDGKSAASATGTQSAHQADGTSDTYYSLPTSGTFRLIDAASGTVRHLTHAEVFGASASTTSASSKGGSSGPSNGKRVTFHKDPKDYITFKVGSRSIDIEKTKVPAPIPLTGEVSFDRGYRFVASSKDHQGVYRPFLAAYTATKVACAHCSMRKVDAAAWAQLDKQHQHTPVCLVMACKTCNYFGHSARYCLHSTA